MVSHLQHNKEKLFCGRVALFFLQISRYMYIICTRESQKVAAFHLSFASGHAQCLYLSPRTQREFLLNDL